MIKAFRDPDFWERKEKLFWSVIAIFFLVIFWGGLALLFLSIGGGA